MSGKWKGNYVREREGETDMKEQGGEVFGYSDLNGFL